MSGEVGLPWACESGHPSLADHDSANLAARQRDAPQPDHHLSGAGKSGGVGLVSGEVGLPRVGCLLPGESVIQQVQVTDIPS